MYKRQFIKQLRVVATGRSGTKCQSLLSTGCVSGEGTRTVQEQEPTVPVISSATLSQLGKSVSPLKNGNSVTTFHQFSDAQLVTL